MQTLSYFSSVKGNEILCSIEEMINFSEKDPEIMEGKKSGFYRINCYLAFIPGMTDESRSLIYLACQNCKKKVTDNGEAYFCESCQEAQKEVTPSYIFSAKLQDYTDAIYCTFIGNENGEALTGVSSLNYHNYRADGNTKLTGMIEQRYFTPLDILIKARLDNYQGNSEGPKIKYYC